MKRHKNYYDMLIANSEIGKIALEFIADRITTETPDIVFYICLHHVSESGKSLQINIDKRLWCCFGCNQCGNVLLIVEFINSGNDTRGTTVTLSNSHCVARDHLAQRVNRPPLGTSGLSAEEIHVIELKHTLCSATYGYLTAIADYYHCKLKLNEEALDRFFSNHMISPEIMSDLKINVSDNTAMFENLKKAGFRTEDLLSSRFLTNTSYNFSRIPLVSRTRVFH